MVPGDTDAAWEKLGSDDPYFGVVSHERFRRERLDEGALDDFFRSGEEHVDSVLATIRERLDPGFRPASVLDFGCGVGRLVIPFAREGARVVGVDVSESMLREARANCERFGAGEVELVSSDDRLSRITGTFDLVHSFIVFQHIPPARGRRILEALLGRLNAGGVGALHFTYGRRAPFVRRAVHELRKRVPLFNGAVNLALGRPASEPMMQMNNYGLNGIFSLLQAAGCAEVYATLTDHGGHLGVMLYFRKSAAGAS